MSEDESKTDLNSKSEESTGIPKSSVSRIIQTALPLNIKCTNETRNLLLECATEFIHLLSAQANEICEKGAKKTISPEHVLKALNELGFDEYIEEINKKQTEMKEILKEQKQKIKIKKETKKNTQNEQELLEKQQKLFEEAKSNAK